MDVRESFMWQAEPAQTAQRAPGVYDMAMWREITGRKAKPRSPASQSCL